FPAAGLERDEHSPLILRSVTSCERDHGLHILVLRDDAYILLHLLPHGCEGDVLIGLYRSNDASGILLREESLRNLPVQIHTQSCSRNRDKQRRELMAQDETEAHAISTQ